MAPKKPKPKDGQKKPKSPQKPKNPQQEKKEIKENLRKQIEAEVEKLEAERFIRREDVRMAIGIGNYKDWEKQVEINYVGSTSQPASEATKPNRPQIKKISRRKKRRKK